MFLVSMFFAMVHPYIFIHFMEMFFILVTICCKLHDQQQYLYVAVELNILVPIHIHTYMCISTGYVCKLDFKVSYYV